MKSTTPLMLTLACIVIFVEGLMTAMNYEGGAKFCAGVVFGIGIWQFVISIVVSRRDSHASRLAAAGRTGKVTVRYGPLP